MRYTITAVNNNKKVAAAKKERAAPAMRERPEKLEEAW